MTDLRSIFKFILITNKIKLKEKITSLISAKLNVTKQLVSI